MTEQQGVDLTEYNDDVDPDEALPDLNDPSQIPPDSGDAGTSEVSA